MQVGIQMVFLMRTTCELETHIVAVERIAEYAGVTPEVIEGNEFSAGN